MMDGRRTTDTDNMYEVTVQATDADRRMGTKPVTVEVTNVDEPGVVTLSARQPMAGVLLTATITDPDGYNRQYDHHRRRMAVAEG